jgi:hypothetical protein
MVQHPAGTRPGSRSADGPHFRLEAERGGTSYQAAMYAFVSRAALCRPVTEAEVGTAVVAMLGMPGRCGARAVSRCLDVLALRTWC